MSSQKKMFSVSRSRMKRAFLDMAAARAVVLDTVGFVKCRRGHGVLRLKLVGPVDALQRLDLSEGARVSLERHHLVGEGGYQESCRRDYRKSGSLSARKGLTRELKTEPS